MLLSGGGKCFYILKLKLHRSPAHLYTPPFSLIMENQQQRREFAFFSSRHDEFLQRESDRGTEEDRLDRDDKPAIREMDFFPCNNNYSHDQDAENGSSILLDSGVKVTLLIIGSPSVIFSLVFINPQLS